jgi:EmrB/QacA subfamily drug resistance transporter
MADAAVDQAPEAPAGGPDTGHPRRWVILGVLVVSVLVVVLDNTILNVALRVLADPEQGLGATQAELEWSINSYTLVFAGLLFTFGVLGDRLGRRRMLLTGLALFGLSSLASAYTQDPGQLIAARALMGLSAAAIMPATLSIISNVFHPRDRAHAVGVWAGSVGLGVAIGPLTGGFLLEHFWWGSIFLVNVPVAAGGLLAVSLLVPESRDPHPGRPDLLGMALSVVGLVALVYGIIDGGEHGWDRPAVWLAVATGAVVLAGFVAWELRIRHPSLDVRLFRDPRFATATGALALMFFAAFGVFFFTTFFLQLVRGLSPLAAGAMLVPFAVAHLVFAPRSAALVQRYGPKAVTATGLGLAALALAGWMLIDEHSPLWVLGLLFFVQGAGMANVTQPAIESILVTLPRERAGVGSAVANTVRQVGGALGVAVLGAVVMAVYRSQVGPAAAALPPDARDDVRESIAGAYAAAERLGLPELTPAADHAFVTAIHTAAGLSATITALTVLVVLRWLPGRPARVPRQRRAGPEPARAGPEPARALAEVTAGRAA